MVLPAPATDYGLQTTDSRLLPFAFLPDLPYDLADKIERDGFGGRKYRTLFRSPKGSRANNCLEPTSGPAGVEPSAAKAGRWAGDKKGENRGNSIPAPK